MSADRRRMRAFWRRLTDDPYRKLLAIGLAVLMWLFIDQRITKTITRELPLRVAGESEGEGLAIALPTDRVVGQRFLDGDEEIHSVNLVMTGPRFRIEALETELLNLVITEFQSLDTSSAADDEGKVRFLEFSAANIQLDQRLRDVNVTLDPQRVRLEYTVTGDIGLELARADQQGLIEIDAGGIADRVLLDTAFYTPKEARVVGPAYALHRLEQRVEDGGAPMFRVRLEASGNNTRVSAPLEIVGGEELGLRFETKPYLHIELSPAMSAFQVVLPVLVDDLNLQPDQRGLYKPAKPKRNARVMVAGELLFKMTSLSDGADATKLQSWASENLRLVVHVPKQPAGLPAELVREARIVPVDRLLETVDRSECKLADPIVVTLRNP